MIQKNNNNQAFTLIEMVVAIAIFTIFISMISGTYLYVARAQRDSAEMRKVYSGARDVVSDISQDVKLQSVYYGCYEGSAMGISECLTTVDLTQGNEVDHLALYSGDEAEVFYAEDGVVYVNEYVFDGASWLPASGYEDGAKAVTAAPLTVDGLYFRIFPAYDPDEYYDDVSLQFQPHITVYIDSSYSDILNFSLQTSVSTRTYVQN
ncbi:hypothetical protein COW94_01120 [Candidatus Peregrinibacteria bacterium CG22_combo_CG10-13_8_21_14_all_44_10]|nr:MAG: hypothetical protein AUK45_04825 [Candidatus Peregrinibacteria bacterium CG2_30_44_17]PIP66559.1 MAG: hypothetical protein COW94_01120 [Candidatus Peregrinibacteria bacterium CG22_combo_CG10-13_8_21_14_all_44_10]PIS04289.1 MAG: hypothetical protein COT83_01410 [Candidatus Peregrinibacteria bacterium CG10_big_fil_rev_8_21_14_0_10_44_7]PIX80466.1 MAG: hypothetical protein COZ35_00660 [Candidatus Peregrinibacteria bacterium CG_4_10_14_3_um_filter_44_21]PJB89022.1 MAG: hypothetical protein 